MEIRGKKAIMVGGASGMGGRAELLPSGARTIAIVDRRVPTAPRSPPASAARSSGRRHRSPDTEER